MSKTICSVSVGNIVMDRWPFGPETLSLIDYLKAGGAIGPIHVRPNGRGQYTILDGRHRVLAYKMLGWQTIEVRYGERMSSLTVHSPCPQADGWSEEAKEGR